MVKHPDDSVILLRISGDLFRGYVGQVLVDGKVIVTGPVAIDMTDIATQEAIDFIAELSVTLKPSEDTAKSFGKWLYDEVLNGLLGRVELPSKRIGLHVLPRELEYVPWELLHDGDEFLVLADGGTLYRHPAFDFNKSGYLGVNQAMQFLRDTELRAAEGRGSRVIVEQLARPRVLVAFCNPTDIPGPLDLHREMTSLRSALNATDRCTADVLEQAVKADVVERLSNGAYQAFHFSGHGVLDGKTRKGALVLCDRRGHADYLWVDELIQLRRREHLLPKLFVLSACQTTHTPFMGGFKDLARGLIEATSSTVIAMQYPILDESAIEFAREFYRCALAGGLVEDAVHAGRVQMFRRHGANQTDFATPVIYQERQIQLVSA